MPSGYNRDGTPNKGQFQKGRIGTRLGCKHTKESKIKMSKTLKGIKLKDKGHKSDCLCSFCKNKFGINHWNWQGGITQKIGYEKEYNRTRYKTNPIYRRNKLLRNFKRRVKCKIDLKILQQIYENNIKQHRTLTCYLCLKSIPFGKDHLEHKIPLSRGGTNDYENLDIACQHCNCSKNSKTETEYRKELLCHQT